MANLRQVVADKGITSDKSYYDFLYGYLQLISDWNGEGERYIMKENLSYSKLETELGNSINRKTISKVIKFLEANNLVKNDHIELSHLDELDEDERFLIDMDTLKALVAYRKRHLIDLYVYLFNGMYYAKMNNGENSVVITMKNMKDYIGIATSTTSNNGVVKELLDILVEVGLIAYKIELDPVKMHSYYRFTKVNQRIKKL